MLRMFNYHNISSLSLVPLRFRMEICFVARLPIWQVLRNLRMTSPKRLSKNVVKTIYFTNYDLSKFRKPLGIVITLLDSIEKFRTTSCSM